MIRAVVVLLVIAYFLRRKESEDQHRAAVASVNRRALALLRRWHLEDLDVGIFNTPSWSSDALNEPTYAGGEW